MLGITNESKHQIPAPDTQEAVALAELANYPDNWFCYLNEDGNVCFCKVAILEKLVPSHTFGFDVESDPDAPCSPGSPLPPLSVLPELGCQSDYRLMFKPMLVLPGFKIREFVRYRNVEPGHMLCFKTIQTGCPYIGESECLNLSDETYKNWQTLPTEAVFKREQTVAVVRAMTDAHPRKPDARLVTPWGLVADFCCKNLEELATEP